MADQVTLPEDQDQFKLNEVCKLANVQPYMLRFWGTEFQQLEAGKSSTGQRLYSREQVELILEIRRLLFEEGLTIAGARKKVAAMHESGEFVPPVQPEVETAPAAVDEPEPDEDEDEPEAAPEPEKKAMPPKATVRTSSARRTTKKKAAAPKVDKTAAADVQPLLATLKNVRDEIDKIVTELKGD